MAAYLVRMVRGRVVVSLLDEHGKVDRSMEFEPDYACHFADALIERVAEAREWLQAQAEHLADRDSD